MSHVNHLYVFIVILFLFFSYRIHGVCVCDTADYFHNHIDEQLKIYGMTTNREGKPLQSRDIVDVIEGHKGRGYGLSTDDELGNIIRSENLAVV